MNYALFIKLYRDIQIIVGSLGKIYFKKGNYLYVGSAKINFKSRIKRHLLKDKKIFWHIDYLLSSKNAIIKEVWVTNKIKECNIAKLLNKMGCNPIKDFGSSDCKCFSHLFFINNIREVKSLFKIKGFINYLI